MHFKLETILFDLDGVLADTESQIRQTYLDVLRDFQIEPPSDSNLADLIRLSPQKGLRLLLGESAGSALNSYSHHWKINISRVKAYKGIADVINSLSCKGKIIGVVTSRNSSDTTQILANNNLSASMNVVVTWGDYRVAKPSPKCLQVALGMIQKPSDTSSYVGDQPNDILAATGAGVIGLAATWGGNANQNELVEAGAYAILRSPSELLDLM